MDNTAQQPEQAIKKKLRLYKGLFWALFISVIIGAVFGIRYWCIVNAGDIGLSTVSKNAPHYDKVKEIIKPLRYSLIKNILDENVTITMGFDKKLWGLDNIYHYNSCNRNRLCCF